MYHEASCKLQSVNTALKSGCSGDLKACFHSPPGLQGIFNTLEERGQLTEQESQQLYSEAAGKFLADRLVSGTCPKCGYEVRPWAACFRSSIQRHLHALYSHCHTMR